MAVILSGVVLLVLCCCGAFTYNGWWQPRERMEQRRQLHSQIGVPAGFTEQRVGESVDNEVLATSYLLTCEKGACPVNLAESVQSWLADAGATGVTIRDVADCIDDHVRWGGTACEGWTWQRDGFEMTSDIVNILPKYVGPGRTDKEVILSLSIGRQG
ncbi:hypothetical protein [Micromonospora purpureochromogenes]|uniref:Uncharacterized protein n=1 Tax=Micromonospora purpureochromogenes TaxID=47872 RepID=A0ABX2RL54_9ACTN|nr:hypothetical protein [Micromonospora purpureochromogenes]NYF57260.1 hypothetical protein [Micromonospora purpureochromogenes]